MSREARMLALGALENSVDLVEEDYANAVNLYGKYPSRAQRLIGMETMRDDHRKAITALREDLAKPDFWEGYVPEPTVKQSLTVDQPAQQCRRELSADGSFVCDCKLAQQEPVAWTNWRELVGARYYQTPGWEMYADKRNPDDVALYTSPPAQRTWVGLTDEERKLVRNSVGYNQFVTAGEYAEHVQKATEFKLRSKNEDHS